MKPSLSSNLDWELVIDNNSGTYAPDKNLLPQLRALLKHNFPWFEIYALDRDDPELAKRAWRKVDLHVMPIAVILYLSSYIDR